MRRFSRNLSAIGGLRWDMTGFLTPAPRNDIPAATIPTNSGRTKVNDSRIATEVGRVLELTGDTKLDQRSVVVQGSWLTPGNASIEGSYTWNRTYDNSSFNCCIARTSVFTPIKDDPRDLSASWGPSDYDFRHKAVVSAISPELWGFRLSARYVGQTGQPISAVISGDVNGDDIANNDLAFVFDPDDAATPAGLRDGMRTVLNNPVAQRYTYQVNENFGVIRKGGDPYRIQLGGRYWF